MRSHCSLLTKIMCCVTYLYEVVDSLEVRQVVISHIHTDTEVQASITTVNNLEVPELCEQQSKCLLADSLSYYDNSSFISA